ncbi:MAG TPA: PrpF domain-containing protein, partial [Aquella sp.]|nr:PrpF domain-containing protein [Aquella sp.]
ISTEGRVHHAYTGTGAINLACAAKIPGTIPYNVINKGLDNSSQAISIGHPQGIMKVNASVKKDITSEKWFALSAGFERTAKLIMSGEVYS